MKLDLRVWSARLRRWGWITQHETGRRVGFVAAGFVETRP
jgi:hypothetical protein